MQDRYVAKRLKQHFLFPGYTDQDRTSESTNDVAKYLRRERDHLHRFYDSVLPDLMPDEKIMVLDPEVGHPAGEIMSLQEKLGEHIPLYRLDIAELTDEYQKEVRDQLEAFVQATKAMAVTRDEQDTEFSNAIPDITHLSNLALEAHGDHLRLRLFDTNYVLPVDCDRAISQHHLERCSYRLVWIEHHLLGKSLDEIGQDPFYSKNGIIDLIKARLPEVPNLNSNDLFKIFAHPSSTPHWRRKVQEEPAPTIPAPKK
jgi:hypothetical protein